MRPGWRSKAESREASQSYGYVLSVRSGPSDYPLHVGREKDAVTQLCVLRIDSFTGFAQAR